MEVHHQAAPAVSGGEGSRSSAGELLARCGAGLCSSVAGFGRKLGKIARDDPRRVAHSLKVGLALTLVSVLYYVRPLFNNWGLSTLWAVLTVVVVMEYTVGGTLIKGLNRAFATLAAGFLAVGAHKLADLCGAKGEPVLLAVFVFLLASAATFSRFIPEVKARYDYGVTIFILTFSLVAVSSYRVEELIRLAHQRFCTIAVGVATCLLTTVFVIPVWAGEDLHKLAAANLDKLAEFLEGLESECFGENGPGENLESKAFLYVYKSVLHSKATEDSLSNFAKWEPPHGKFFFRYPWSQYQNLGALSRQCASSMQALASYIITLTKSQVTANSSLHFRHQRIREPCLIYSLTALVFSQHPEANLELCLKARTACGEISLNSAKALRELSAAIRMMTVPSSAKTHMSAAIKAARTLGAELAEDDDLAKVMHVAVVASLLSELVVQTKKIAESVDNLAKSAHFKKPEEDTQKDVVINVGS
ncbi:hypothetical protein HU200_053080 [Digitaria exilis]|uniref:Aluminum-activated malate transporter n=1 Tax=Digitaria exilis TaxID=1010633 RepID=A0A835AN90_9POAL|nr:hypothetical protein HU200_053080 [Digitaria exilis]